MKKGNIFIAINIRMAVTINTGKPRMEARKILSVNIALTQSARSLPYLFDMTIKYDQGNDTILESLYAIELVKQVKEKYKPYLDKQSEDIFIRFEELTTRTYTNTVASPCFFFKQRLRHWPRGHK